MSKNSGMGWRVGLEPSRVRCLGHVWDVPGLPGTLGWDGQWDWSPRDTWDKSGISLGRTVGIMFLHCLRVLGYSHVCPTISYEIGL